MEDDVDWDVRIKQQLHDFALSTQALSQPLVGSRFTVPELAQLEGDYTSFSLPFDDLPETMPPQVSPYGDHWDLLWVGHCGSAFPAEDDPEVPKGVVIHEDDSTVPAKKHLWSLISPFILKDAYPAHTRAVHYSQEGVCSLAYAVSHKGAVKLLEEVGLTDMSDAFDILLRFFCEGARGMRRHKCLTIQPGLFHHHRAAGSLKADSDIEDREGGFRDESMSDMIRLSVRMNVDAILDGTELIDQFLE